MYNTIDHKNKIGEENSKRWMNGILTCNLKHCQFQNNQDIFRKVMGWSWRWFWCGSMFTNRSNICCSLQNIKYFGKQNHWLDGGDLKDNNSNPTLPWRIVRKLWCVDRNPPGPRWPFKCCPRGQSIQKQ